jgi:hypothetical protein
VATYTVYADEAWTHDDRLRFWRFYGGAMMLSSNRDRIEAELRAVKRRVGLHGEVKWTEVRPNKWKRFALIVDRFFDFVDSGDIRLRYMWLDQMFQEPERLTEYHREFGYYILYYFFLVFGFGLPWHDGDQPILIEFHPDELPDELSKRSDFTRFLMRCHRSARFDNLSEFRIIDVGEVTSRDHLILQCVDLIIGAVGAKLNKTLIQKGPSGRRFERTIVKELLYKHIRQRIGDIDMRERGTRHFSVGVNTGTGSDFANRWRHKFRQWNFRKPGAFNPRWNQDLP